MPYLKNEEVTVEITALGNDGEGIGHLSDGMTVFIPGTVPGDKVLAHIVKVKKTCLYAICKEVIAPSSFRVKEECPVAAKCGGCTLQHLSYDKQLEYKENKVKDCIERIGGIKNPPMEPIIAADKIYHFRNKGQFPAGRDKEGNFITGFYRVRSHDVVANTDCAIESKITGPVIEATVGFMRSRNVSSYDEETGKGLIRHIYTRVGFFTHEVMVCLVVNGEKVPGSDELKDILVNVCEENGYRLACFCININKKKTNVILGNECKLLYGNLYITDTIGDISYRISPLSFYQVNPEQTKKLYDTAVEYAGLTGDEVVWDLYCGIGTISLYLSKKAKKVYGVEIVPEAIDDARINAEINNITNAEFYVGASEDVAPKLPKPDVIVVDPPRKGCDEKLLKTIIETAPKRLVYVSCDPATLARDLKILSENGFTLDRVRPADQFCHSCHVESCVLLERVSNRKADSYVKLNVKMADYYRIKDLKGGEADG